jgi:hypothetical protein
MADAGLDQTVTDGTPVELDGSGSLHPDGQITAYEWSIEADGQGKKRIGYRSSPSIRTVGLPIENASCRRPIRMSRIPTESHD